VDKVIGVLGGAVNEGARVVLWRWLGHVDQEWCTQPE
jgi:hypothetical protein